MQRKQPKTPQTKRVENHYPTPPSTNHKDGISHTRRGDRFKSFEREFTPCPIAPFDTVDIDIEDDDESEGTYEGLSHTEDEYGLPEIIHKSTVPTAPSFSPRLKVVPCSPTTPSRDGSVDVEEGDVREEGVYWSEFHRLGFLDTTRQSDRDTSGPVEVGYRASSRLKDVWWIENKSLSSNNLSSNRGLGGSCPRSPSRNTETALTPYKHLGEPLFLSDDVEATQLEDGHELGGRNGNDIEYDNGLSLGIVGRRVSPTLLPHGCRVTTLTIFQSKWKISKIQEPNSATVLSQMNQLIVRDTRVIRKAPRETKRSRGSDGFHEGEEPEIEYVGSIRGPKRHRPVPDPTQLRITQTAEQTLKSEPIDFTRDDTPLEEVSKCDSCGCDCGGYQSRQRRSESQEIGVAGGSRMKSAWGGKIPAKARGAILGLYTRLYVRRLADVRSAVR